MKKILPLLMLLVSCVSVNSTSSSSNNESSLISSIESSFIESSSSNEDTILGNYVLISKTVNDVDVTSQYLYGLLSLSEEIGVMEFVDAYGKTREEGTYTYSETTLALVVGVKTYNFTITGLYSELRYSGRINKKNVEYVFSHDFNFEKEATEGLVAFNEELFGDNINENFYNYCPTAFFEGNAIMHIYYCANKTSGNVTDYIIYRRGNLNYDGKWVFSAKEIVLEPTPATWDARHTCDPSVVKGVFSYNEVTYSYLMAYLGCVTNDSSRNEVGIAVATSPEGPWIKVVEVNPIANYYESIEYISDEWTWGYGQPSLLSVDKEGKVLLFYTKGIISGTFEYVEEWDLTDLNNPLKISAKNISNYGVVNASGQTDVINNADFTYDALNNLIYVIKEDFPYMTNGQTDWLTGANTVLVANLNSNDKLDSLFTDFNVRWEKIDSINQNATGFARVHNACIVTDAYGWLINPYQLPFVYTSSALKEDFPNWDSGGQWPALHTYRLHGYLLEL
ncbi:MAG: hypothetical protein LBM99_06410 [Bacillales bacterium]|jgi:hypothetical protein|nr:hypothetical protein [Bacillales bacterium]